eukprot:3306074-Amphidinium_carterae.1
MNRHKHHAFSQEPDAAAHPRASTSVPLQLEMNHPQIILEVQEWVRPTVFKVGQVECYAQRTLSDVVVVQSLQCKVATLAVSLLSAVVVGLEVRESNQITPKQELTGSRRCLPT